MNLKDTFHKHRFATIYGLCAFLPTSSLLCVFFFGKVVDKRMPELDGYMMTFGLGFWAMIGFTAVAAMMGHFEDYKRK